MPFCIKCGIDLLDDAKFCLECGTPVVKSSGSQQEKKPSEVYSDKTQIRGKHQEYGVISFENIPVGYIISERYEVQEKVGQGGFGAVYRCFDRNMNIDKALKIIPEAVSSDKETMFDLQNEARTMIALNHPNIVRVYDFHRSGDIKFIDMEFLDGKNLNEIKLEFSDKRIPEARVKEYALKIAEGMLYAHESGDNVILHRDLKPHNVRLTSQGVIKIMDFGIAETVRTSMSRLDHGSSSGTLVYMSPEQLRGRDIGREADIYSFGAMLYELLSGQPPFYKGSIEHQIINEKPEPLEHVSAEMNGFLLKCLEKDYKNRYRNFNEIIKGLGGEPSLASKVGVISSPIQSRSVTSEIKKLVEVSIKTNPSVAMIDIDGSILKYTPFNQKLSVGKHRVKISKPGYRQVESEIVIADSPGNDFFIELESIMGSIAVGSDEPNCDIVLNKKETGCKTPHTFTEIIPGEKYLVQVKKDGYHSLPTNVTIEEKESKIIKFLNASIKTNPDAAAIDIVNISGRQTPISLLLFPDKYPLKIRKEGYKLLETEVTISEDSSNDFHIDLEPVFGKLTVASKQAGITIILNGSKTPYKTPHTFEGIIPRKEYRVELESNNFYSEPVTIMLNEKEEKTVQPELIRFSVLTIETAFQDIKFSLNNKNYNKTELILLRKGKYTLKPSYNYLPDLEVNVEKNQDLTVKYDKIVPKRKLLIEVGKHTINAVYQYRDDFLSVPLKPNEQMELLSGAGTVTIESNILNKEYIADDESEITIDFLQEIDTVLAEKKEKRLTKFKSLSKTVSKIAVVAVIAFLVTTYFVRREKAWKKAQEIATLQSYEDYLAKYPIGIHAKKVLKKYPALEKSMVFVKGGTFKMGRTRGSGYDNELPVHDVTLNSFYISKNLVTQKEYKKIMGHNPASIFFGRGKKYPVYSVTWYGAIQFCNLLSMKKGLTPVYSINGSTNPRNWGSDKSKVVCDWEANGYRLPTEAEWEYAARGGTNSPDYLYSGSNDIGKVARYSSNNPIHAGVKSPNGLGIYDMSGNLFEWCWDWYDKEYYKKSPANDPKGPSKGTGRVFRGGCWHRNATQCRVVFRSSCKPDSGGNLVGFRIGMTVP